MYYLGIDGGGSRTRALLCDASGKPIGRGLSGPTNPRVTPITELRANLLNAIQQACAPVAISKITAAHLGIAGCSDSTTQATLAKIARECMVDHTTQITVGHDLEIALEGGLIGQPGIVLVAGTGSACYGQDAQGIRAQCGGWGDLVDDAGSGSWIGLRALQTAVRQADGRENESALLHRVMQFLKIDSMAAFKARIHEVGLTRSERAQLAPIVIELAQAGDCAAAKIMAEAIEELCSLALSTSQQLQLPQASILLAGGLTEDRFFYESLAQALPAHIASAVPVRAQLDPVSGAVLRALRNSAVAISKDSIQELNKTCEN